MRSRGGSGIEVHYRDNGDNEVVGATGRDAGRPSIGFIHGMQYYLPFFAAGVFVLDAERVLVPSTALFAEWVLDLEAPDAGGLPATALSAISVAAFLDAVPFPVPPLAVPFAGDFVAAAFVVLGLLPIALRLVAAVEDVAAPGSAFFDALAVAACLGFAAEVVAVPPDLRLAACSFAGFVRLAASLVVLAPVRVVPCAVLEVTVPFVLVAVLGSAIVPVAVGASVLPVAGGELVRDAFALVPADAFFATAGFVSAAGDFFAIVVPAAFEVFGDVAMVLSRIVKRNR